MARCSLTGLGLKLLSLNQPEAQETRDDQKDRYDIIKQLRHDQDEDAGKQRDDRLKVCDGYGALWSFSYSLYWSLPFSAAGQKATLDHGAAEYCEHGAAAIRRPAP